MQEAKKSEKDGAPADAEKVLTDPETKDDVKATGKAEDVKMDAGDEGGAVKEEVRCPSFCGLMHIIEVG